MEIVLFILLGAAVVIGLPIAAILGVLAFFQIDGLRLRLGALERRLQAAETQLFALERRPGTQGASVAPEVTPAEVVAGVAPTPEPETAPAPPSSIEATPPLEATVEAPPPAEERPVEEAPATTLPEAASVPAASVPPPRPPRDLESLIGARWTVWVGGLALALGGIFLARFAIEQGWFGPEARLMLAALLGLALVGAGEVLRRRGLNARIAELEYADIPSILVAAGVSTLFSTLYAAHALYGFIGPAATFAGLATIALGTVLVALFHKPWLAGLGLVGGYLAPVLVESSDPSTWPVVLLVLALTATAFALQRLKRWMPIAWMGLIGHGAWSVLLLPISNDQMALSFHALGLAGLALGLGALRTHFANAPNEPSRTDARLSLAGTGIAALLAAALVAQWGEAGMPLLAAILLVIVLAAAAVLIAGELRWNAPIAGALAVATVAAFDVLPTLNEVAKFAVVVDRSVDEVILIASGFGALFAIGGLWIVTRINDVRLILTGAATPVALLAVAYLRFRYREVEGVFALLALALGAGGVFIAEWLGRRDPDGRSALWGAAGIYAAASAAAIGLALGLWLPEGGLALGFALASFGIAAVWRARPLPLLPWAAMAAGLVALYFLWRYRLAVLPDRDALPILNSLLPSMALPALALGAAAHLLGRGADWRPASVLEALASLLGIAWLWLALEHATTGEIGMAPERASDLGLRIVVLLIAARLFERLCSFARSLVYRIAGNAALALAGITAITALLLTADSAIFRVVPIRGGVIINDLLLAYLIPGLAALIFAGGERRRRPGPIAIGIEILGHLLLAAYGIFEIMVLHRGPSLAGPMSNAEMWSYSAGALAYGIALLAAGFLRERRSLRVASGAVLVGTAVKIFVLDMAGLTGLWRALSFLALGAVLIGIGLLYQRLLGRKPAREG